MELIVELGGVTLARGGGVLVLFWVMSKGNRSDHVKIEVAKKGTQSTFFTFICPYHILFFQPLLNFRRVQDILGGHLVCSQCHD